MTTIQHRAFRGMIPDIAPENAPKGALRDGLNVMCRRPGIIEPRPGMEALYVGDDDTSLASASMDDVQNAVEFHGGSVFLCGDGIVNQPSGSSGGGNVLSGADLHDGFCSSAKARGNLYVARRYGPITIHDNVASPSFLRSGQNPSAAVVLLELGYPGANRNWLANNYAIGYRVVTRKTDPNGLVTRSLPSPLYYVENTSGATSPLVTISRGFDFTLSYYDIVFEIYRTRSVPGSVPSSECYLALELEYDGTPSQSFYDEVTDDELGAALYSNSGPAHAAPDNSKVLAFFAGSLIQANVTGRQHFPLRLKSGDLFGNAKTVADCNITSGSPTVTVNSITSKPDGSAGVVIGQLAYHADFPGGSSEVLNVSGSAVTLSENATASASGTSVEFFDRVSIESDSQTFVIQLAAVNFEGIGFNDWFVTVDSDKVLQDPSVPGAGVNGVVIWERVFTDTTMKIKATNGPTMFDRAIPEFTGTAADFLRDVEPALLRWSERGKPEEFTPGVGEVWVGDEQQEILAVEGRADRAFIFKTDGIWVLEGQGARSGFRLYRLSDHELMTPRHTCSTEAGVAAWTSDGVILISDSGAITNISKNAIGGTYLSRFRRPSTDPDVITGNLAFVPDDNELHLLCEQPGLTDPDPDLDIRLHLVFNAQTGTWHRWQISDSGAVLAFAPGNGGARASFLQRPYASGLVYTWQPVEPTEGASRYFAHCDRIGGPYSAGLFGSSGGGFFSFQNATSFVDEQVPKAGDWVIDSAFTYIGIVTSVDADGGGQYDIGFYAPNGSTAFSFYLLKSFTSRIELLPQAGDDTAMAKQWQSVQWQFEGRSSLYQLTVGAGSTEKIAEETREITYAFPTLVADRQAQDPPPKARHLFTREHANAQMVSPTLEIAQAGAIWVLTGARVEYTEARAEVSRD